MHCENYIRPIERVDEYCFPVGASAACPRPPPLTVCVCVCVVLTATLSHCVPQRHKGLAPPSAFQCTTKTLPH